MRPDHPRCRSARWICRCGHTHDVVFHVSSKSVQEFRSPWGRISPFFITLAIGFYNIYWTIRDENVGRGRPPVGGDVFDMEIFWFRYATVCHPLHRLLTCCWYDRRRRPNLSTLRAASPSTTTSLLTDAISSASTFCSTTTMSRTTHTASLSLASLNRHRSELVRTPPSYTSHCVSFYTTIRYDTIRYGRLTCAQNVFFCARCSRECAPINIFLILTLSGRHVVGVRSPIWR